MKNWLFVALFVHVCYSQTRMSCDVPAANCRDIKLAGMVTMEGTYFYDYVNDKIIIKSTNSDFYLSKDIVEGYFISAIKDQAKIAALKDFYAENDTLNQIR